MSWTRNLYFIPLTIKASVENKHSGHREISIHISEEFFQ